MKINNIKLNKKNFWIPFLVSSGISFLIFLFGLFTLLGMFSQGIMVYLSWFILERGFMFVSLFALASTPSFFIIKRLLNKKPKKVFYFELPILILIYSLTYFFNQIIGLMFGGPLGMSTMDILGLMLRPILFIISWLSILTISLYFYYKKIKK